MDKISKNVRRCLRKASKIVAYPRTNYFSDKWTSTSIRVVASMLMEDEFTLNSISYAMADCERALLVISDYIEKKYKIRPRYKRTWELDNGNGEISTQMTVTPAI